MMELELKNQTNPPIHKLDSVSTEFIAFVAHQIKSPLSAIKGYSGLLADGTYGEMNAERKSVILKIHAAAERALELAHNLLDFKKIEEGAMHYRMENHDLVKIISDVVDELHLLAQQKKLELIFEPKQKELLAVVDKMTFHQVIQNLVDNAIKYTRTGWVKIELSKEGGKITVKVSDSGRGMSEEVAPTVFDKFARDLEASREIKGAGLGLFIVKNIVEAHHGRIWAESEGENKGSTFFIEIPA